MKKTVTTLFFAFTLMTSAYAQGIFSDLRGNNGLWLDSLIVTYVDGTRTEKNIYEYNSDKLPICRYQYEYNENQELIPTTRTENTFNEDKNLAIQESFIYDQGKGEFVLSERDVISAWNEISKIPSTILRYGIDEDNPEAGIQLLNKEVLTDFNEQGNPVDAHYYAIREGQEVLIAKAHLDYYENGLPKEENVSGETIDSGDTLTYVSKYTYKYDSYGNETESTVLIYYNGVEAINEVTTHRYEYDENDNPKKAYKSYTTKDPSGKRDEIGYYYWGDGTATLIRALKAARMNNIFFDLSGRQHQGTPTEKGIYIVNGKKVVID